MDDKITAAKIAIFRKKEIRKTIHNNEWWFSVADVVQALTDTPNIKDYIRKMRIRDNELGKGWGQIVTPLSIETLGGKQMINCANTEGIFRIIQSIPSPKAEPFKRWLAKVGYERIKEIEDSELAIKRIVKNFPIPLLRAIMELKRVSLGIVKRGNKNNNDEQVLWQRENIIFISI